MSSKYAVGKPQSEYLKRSLEESGSSIDAEEKSVEDSTQVDALGLDDQAPYSPDSGELVDESNHSDSLSSTCSERARAGDVKPEPRSVAGILKPAILSFLPVTNSKEEEKGATAVSKTSSENSYSSFIRSLFPESTKPKELTSHSKVIDDPKPDDSKHVTVQDKSRAELVVMKEAEAELQGELPKQKSSTSAVLGFQPEQERLSVQLPMEQDRSETMSESMQSDAEESCSHDGGKRRMESSDEGSCVSPLKRRNQKLEETL